MNGDCGRMAIIPWFAGNVAAAHYLWFMRGDLKMIIKAFEGILVFLEVCLYFSFWGMIEMAFPKLRLSGLVSKISGMNSDLESGRAALDEKA